MIGALGPTDVADVISAQLQALGTPERAAGEQAYLKSALTHFGTSVPDMRAVVRRHVRALAPDHDDVIAICDALWAQPVHERRMAAVELLAFRPALLSVDDLPWIELVLRDCRTWALVDTIAGVVVARIVLDDPLGLDVLDRWVVDDDVWIRRSAVLGLRSVLRAGRELDRFERYSDLLLGEREFFIRKALGWVAREVGRQQPGAIAAWLRARLDRMNGVTIREAVKYLPDGDAILAEWKAR